MLYEVITEEVRKLLAKIDVPVRQVMIEARIVEASDTFSKNLGVRMGFFESGPVGRHIGGGIRGPNIGAELVNTGQGMGIVQGTPVINGPGLNSNFPATGLNSFNAGQISFIRITSYNVCYTKLLRR